jgi:hypothetical protein
MSANQSRRRTDLGAGPVPGNAKPQLDSTLPYQGRALDKDSIRLVEIQPAAHDDDPVMCTLNEVAFCSRPKFEALSYMWGTELADEPITLNGFAFEVKKNLLDALLFLRRQVKSGTARQPFWIDAIPSPIKIFLSIALGKETSALPAKSLTDHQKSAKTRIFGHP